MKIKQFITFRFLPDFTDLNIIPTRHTADIFPILDVFPDLCQHVSVTSTTACVFARVRSCWQWQYERNPTAISASELPWAALVSIVTHC
jgi:hypothetical protein